MEVKDQKLGRNRPTVLMSIHTQKLRVVYACSCQTFWPLTASVSLSSVRMRTYLCIYACTPCVCACLLVYLSSYLCLRVFAAMHEYSVVKADYQSSWRWVVMVVIAGNNDDWHLLSRSFRPGARPTALQTQSYSFVDKPGPVWPGLASLHISHSRCWRMIGAWQKVDRQDEHSFIQNKTNRLNLDLSDRRTTMEEPSCARGLLGIYKSIVAWPNREMNTIGQCWWFWISSLRKTTVARLKLIFKVVIISTHYPQPIPIQKAFAVYRLARKDFRLRGSIHVCNIKMTIPFLTTVTPPSKDIERRETSSVKSRLM